MGAQSNVPSNMMESEVDKKRNDLKERIDRYGIVNVCGSDLSGRHIIVISAVKLPEADDLVNEKEFFNSHQHFFDVLLE